MLITPVSMTAEAATTSQMKSKVLSIAENEVGYQGTGSYSKYGEWYGWQGAWCTTFVLWCFNKAGNSLNVKLYANIIPSGGNCNSMISWFKNKGRYHTRTSGYTPKKGDLIFFDWSGNGSAQHVGIVKSTSGSTVYTIEGNCSGKVKARQYTTSGSKPYNNISSIMGYGNPNWDSVADGKSSDEKEETTKKKKETTTKKKSTTTKKSSTSKKKSDKKDKKKEKKKESDKKKDKETSEKKEETTESTTESTTKETTTKPVLAKSMKLYAATNDLEVGDSVQLDYAIEPANANAVVGYFCDEENIIDVGEDGTITATGEGKATVVVCANDEIYQQCDFVVKAQSEGDVTRYGGEIVPETATTPSTPVGPKTDKQKAHELGINVEQLESHSQYYILPLSIAGTTAALAVMIACIKKLGKILRSKKEASSKTEE